MNNIQAWYFDLGGVILRTTDRAPRATLGAQFGISYQQIEEIGFSGGRWSSAARASLGAITEEAHWLTVSRRLGLTAAGQENIHAAFFAGDALDWELIDFLRQQRKVRKTGLISNAWSGLRPWIVSQGFADAFDEMIISAEIGIVKPNPRIYQQALQALGVAPQAAVFVDDMLENVLAARALGMRGIHFQTAPQALAEMQALLA